MTKTGGTLDWMSPSCVRIAAGTVVVLLLSGFDFSRHSIPVEEILSGGPPKDGIPALLNPKFVRSDQATFLAKDDRVLGLFENGEAKAFPIGILNWHEVVNDTVGGKPVVITYCPLCGTGMAFDAKVGGERLTFGVSGLLYNSDVLMYDHQTESLWSQIKQEAVTGKMTGSRLVLLPLVHTTWEAWRKEHPGALVLSTDTGFRRDYDRDPYKDYARTSRLMFPAGKPDDRYPAKAWVLGIELGSSTKAYPFTELERGTRHFTDTVGSQRVTVQYDPASRTAWAKDPNGKDIPSVVAYWFAWAAFHPNTELYQASREPGAAVQDKEVVK